MRSRSNNSLISVEETKLRHYVCVCVLKDLNWSSEKYSV